MAKLDIRGLDTYELKLSRLESGSGRIAKEAVYEGAKILADEINEAAKEVLSEDATGQMMESYGITKIDMNENGYWNAKIGFDGYDDKGVPNQMKARVLESGSSKQKKRPFVRPTVNRVKEKVQQRMGQVINEEIEKIMK